MNANDFTGWLIMGRKTTLGENRQRHPWQQYGGSEDWCECAREWNAEIVRDQYYIRVMVLVVKGEMNHVERIDGSFLNGVHFDGNVIFDTLRDLEAAVRLAVDAIIDQQRYSILEA